MHVALKLLLLLIVFILAAAADGLLVYGVKKVSEPQPAAEALAAGAILPQKAQTAPQEPTADRTTQPVPLSPQPAANPSPDGTASASAASREKTPEQASSPTLRRGPPVKVIGNSDSKRYHLPGMTYYDQVEAHHRVEFHSEEEAIKAGYRKAPR